MKHIVTLTDTGEEFLCGEEQHLLQGMQNFHLGVPLLEVIPVGCRGGGCGVCRIRICGGDYETKKMSRKHISADDEEGRVALACRVYPRSEITIEVLPTDDEGGSQNSSRSCTGQLK